MEKKPNKKQLMSEPYVCDLIIKILESCC